MPRGIASGIAAPINELAKEISELAEVVMKMELLRNQTQLS
jgi:hypothetical protein